MRQRAPTRTSNPKWALPFSAKSGHAKSMSESEGSDSLNERWGRPVSLGTLAVAALVHGLLVVFQGALEDLQVVSTATRWVGWLLSQQEFWIVVIVFAATFWMQTNWRFLLRVLSGMPFKTDAIVPNGVSFSVRPERSGMVATI